MKTLTLIILTLGLCYPCYSQDVNIYRNYRLNYRIFNTSIFIYNNPSTLGSKYDQNDWFRQDAAENPLDPVAYSYESNKLLNMPQNVTLTNPPSTADQIKENILRYRRTKNF